MQATNNQSNGRISELDRKIKLAEAEKKCLQLLVGESITLDLDALEFQRMRTQLSRISQSTGKDIRLTAVEGGAKATRYEDVPVN